MEQQSIVTTRRREPAHPTALTYIKIATILAVITAVEVAVFYIDFLEPAFLGIFLVLSAVKFTLVVLFYMHLKFDSRLFSRFFVGGLLLAAAVLISLLALFKVFTA
ncbi:MAG: cytochrome C oxidase subunit IV family protein [Dehalococcoidia bacterium]